MTPVQGLSGDVPLGRVALPDRGLFKWQWGEGAF
jgi:hypothetical protein